MICTSRFSLIGLGEVTGGKNKQKWERWEGTVNGATEGRKTRVDGDSGGQESIAREQKKQ